MKKCPLCGKECKHQGALNLHQAWCKMRNGSQQDNKVAVEKVEENTITVKECEHSWRFLNGNSPIEKKALSANYMEVCSVCQTLR